jgi:hypothetical protein
MKKFWDHLESCWNIEAPERPTAAEVVTFLEENGRRIADYGPNVNARSHLQELGDAENTGLDFDPNIPPLTNARGEKVRDLSEHLNIPSSRPTAGGGKLGYMERYA